MQHSTIAAQYSRNFRLGWTLFWSVWLVVGLAIAWWLPVLGLVMVAVFGGLLMLTLRRLANPAPVIVVDAAGFHDRRLGAPIPWDQIRGLRRQIGGQRIFLQIAVDDPARFLGNAGILKGPMLRINPAMGFAAVGSNLSGMDVSQSDIAAAAEAWWAQAGGPPNAR